MKVGRISYSDCDGEGRTLLLEQDRRFAFRGGGNMSTSKTITLTKDERTAIGCFVENTMIRKWIIRYALPHGLDLRNGETFSYNKETGEVTSPAKCLDITT